MGCGGGTINAQYLASCSQVSRKTPQTITNSTSPVWTLRETSLHVPCRPRGPLQRVSPQQAVCATGALSPPLRRSRSCRQTKINKSGGGVVTRRGQGQTTRRFKLVGPLYYVLHWKLTNHCSLLCVALAPLPRSLW